jgi:hypothetical protein
MYEHDYVCSSVKSKIWYEFRNHRWNVSDSGYSLFMKLSNEVWKEYIKASNYYNDMAINASAEEQQLFAAKAKTCQDIATMLKTRSFKENVMRDCADMFFKQHFEEKYLDSSPNLLGFNNGVLDLDAIEFREGRPRITYPCPPT